MQQLSGLDASFIYFETPNSPGHVFSVYIYDPSTAPGGKVSFQGIVDHIETRLHISRTFRQKLVQVPLGLDHPYWIEDPHFDLEYHVRQIALPHPGDWRQLCIQVARLHSRHLDLSRPLWELYVIEGLDNVEGVPPGRLRHHAQDPPRRHRWGDAARDHQRHPRPVAGRRAPQAHNGMDTRGRAHADTAASRAAMNLARRPARLVRTVARTSPGVGGVRAQLQREDLPMPTGPAPRTRFSGAVSPHRVVEARHFDLATAKQIKALVPGATINDVAIAVVGGALRRYLSEKGELPTESLRVMAPISTRTAQQAGSAGNQATVMVVTASTDIEDPTERLAAVHSSTRASKALAEAVGARDLVQFAEFLPGGLAALAARTASQFHIATRAMPVVNTVVTNVPGPQVPLYLAGAHLVTFFGGAGVADGMGLLHGISSYCGQLIVSVVSCRDMMPDPGHYADCLAASFTEFAEAAGVTT